MHQFSDWAASLTRRVLVLFLNPEVGVEKRALDRCAVRRFVTHVCWQGFPASVLVLGGDPLKDPSRDG